MALLDTSSVKSREDLVRFLDSLLRDHTASGAAWENPDLPRYLDALKAWLEDSDGYYANLKEDPAAVSPWRRVADAFAAARIYE